MNGPKLENSKPRYTQLCNKIYFSPTSSNLRQFPFFLDHNYLWSFGLVERLQGRGEWWLEKKGRRPLLVTPSQLALFQPMRNGNQWQHNALTGPDDPATAGGWPVHSTWRSYWRLQRDKFPYDPSKWPQLVEYIKPFQRQEVTHSSVCIWQHNLLQYLTLQRTSTSLQWLISTRPARKPLKVRVSSE